MFTKVSIITALAGFAMCLVAASADARVRASGVENFVEKMLSDCTFALNSYKACSDLDPFQ